MRQKRWDYCLNRLQLLTPTSPPRSRAFVAKETKRGEAELAKNLDNSTLTSAALLQLISSHAQYGSSDLEKWAFDFLDPKAGSDVLDLGCGTGKQSIPLARLLGNDGRVLAVDVSQPALDQLLSQARALELDDRIDLLRAELDDIGTHMGGKLFDRALSCYALYYARDRYRVLSSIHQALRPKGIFFFCGPAEGNNAELKQFHYALRAENPPGERAASRFMCETGPRLAREIFSAVRVTTFENVLSFDSADGVYQYWRSYNSYDESLDSEFRNRYPS